MMSTRSGFGAILFGGLLLTFGLVLPSALSAQVIESWEVYSALDRSSSIASVSDGTLWVGTSGGVYHYDPATGKVDVYNTEKSLLDINVTAVGVSPETGDLYVGSGDGSVSILRSGGWWTFVSDIANSGRPDPAIRGFRFRGGNAYILTTFGVAVFNPADSTIRDSWRRFSSVAPNTGVNDVLFFHDSVWVALDSGLAVAPASGRDLADPLAWTLYDQSVLCGKQVLSLAAIDDVLNVGTDDGACRFIDGAFSRRSDMGGPIHFGFNGEHIVASSDSRLYIYGNEGRFLDVVGPPRPIVAVAARADGMPVGAMQRDGIAILSDTGLALYAPNGPITNAFEDLAFGLDGSLWAGSGTGGSGIARLIEGDWLNYTSEKTPGLTTNSSWRVNSDQQGRIWVGSFGDGMSVFVPGEGRDVTVVHYDETNSPLRGISGIDSYVIAADVVDDGFGRVWLLNWDDTPGIRGSVLLARARNTSNGSEEFESYPATSTFPSLLRAYSRITIDFNGTKWLGCDRSSGLLYFNENSTDGGVGTWGLVTTANGLPSNTQTALLVDPDGELWIGTPLGLVVLVNPGSVLQNGAGSAIFRTIRSLENVLIRDIAVDALNRKWVGTDNGIVVLSSDGTEVLTTLTKENSPLVNNHIRSILPNNQTGEIYIGTTGGLNKIQTEAISSAEVSELRGMPQPYEVPSTEAMRITGLPLNSMVKILTMSGTLVREFQSPGGSVAFWDGRDSQGEFVPSGVYIIAGKSSLGETVIGKIAVVRR